MFNASLAIQVLPQAKESTELIRIVDKVITYIKSTGVNNFVGPFETTIEGDFDTLMEIASECMRICVREGVGVFAYIKAVYNPLEGVLSIEEKTVKYS